jgi:2-keto-4-pentenoate hydratase/2-oxohepta-3-ene-1,7-dioic acid hydratase in catechol pathway
VAPGRARWKPRRLFGGNREVDMRLATIAHQGAAKPAVIRDDGSAILLESCDPPFRGSLQDLIAAGLAVAREALAAADTGAAVVPAGAVRLLAPLPRPAKNVFCVGRNYAEHIAEGERAQNVKIGVTEVPVFFTKPPTAVIGPGAGIPVFADVSTSIDYEVELAIVIGKPGRDIRPERVSDHIFGYTIVNDVSARDVQRRHGGQFFKGKALDGSCPMGPWIVTADGIADPGRLGIRLWVNGEKRQDSTTAAMIFDIPTLIASLSAGLTLEAGDVIATGTPSGVGYAMDPPRFLRPGDVVTCEIDGIGRLENPVVDGRR